jgi:adenylate kinase
LKDLEKLEAQAGANELPVFDVEFQSRTPFRRYVILPEWVFDTLMAESGRR